MQRLFGLMFIHFSLFLVPTTMPAPTTTLEGKDEIYLAHIN